MIDILNGINNYLKNPIFSSSIERFFVSQGSLARPNRKQDIRFFDFEKPITTETIFSSNNLFAQRLLLNIYEQDLVFLPIKGKLNKEEFYAFYDKISVDDGQAIRGFLEHYLFSFLQDEISITGKWNIESFKTYTRNKIDLVGTEESSLLKNILNSKDPVSATKFFLIQCSGDFLSEASAMGRNIIGNFGRHTSELFKIFIDEYGYGAHQKKHSTLFENLLTDADMHNEIHYYWQYYLPNSMALINYFHLISKNHIYFFRYLGALYYTEATLAYTTVSQTKLIKEVFGSTVNTLYFDEHTHIDSYHGQMAIDELIVPIIEQHGDEWLDDILLGFESFALLQNLADSELYSHLYVHDHLDELKALASQQSTENIIHSFYEDKNEVSVTHIHDENELFTVIDGEIELSFSPYKAINLISGEKIIIPKGILHGSKVISNKCKYQVQAIGDISWK